MEFDIKRRVKEAAIGWQELKRKGNSSLGRTSGHAEKYRKRHGLKPY